MPIAQFAPSRVGDAPPPPDSDNWILCRGHTTKMLSALRRRCGKFERRCFINKYRHGALSNIWVSGLLCRPCRSA